MLKKVFARFSPDEGDERFQHSDSAMGHLLPLLGEMNLTGCNFGPTVLVPEIRKYLPKTRIDGCIAPFTFMHNDEKQLTYETLRDIEAGKQYGGVNIWTAGSINNGSSLKSMRLMMDLVWDNQR